MLIPLFRIQDEAVHLGLNNPDSERLRALDCDVGLAMGEATANGADRLSVGATGSLSRTDGISILGQVATLSGQSGLSLSILALCVVSNVVLMRVVRNGRARMGLADGM